MTVAAELPDHRPARSGRVRQYLRQLMCVAVPSLMLVVAGLFLAPPAAAHAELLETDPADGTELDQAPESVELTFNEHIEQIGAEVSITDGDGTEVTDGDPEIIGPTLTQALTAEG